MMMTHYSWLLLFMPQGGVEPPLARLLRPPRLPFRHCGDPSFPVTVLCAGFEPALSFENGHLKPVRMPSSASRASQRRGKGSNLHPPASETGAESASASATHFSQMPRAGFEPAPKRRSF